MSVPPMDAERRDAREIATEIRTTRGPNRVMEVQRAQMWDRNPSQWTRYERILADALEAALKRDEHKALRELAGYVRAHLAGNDADPELQWALDLADTALAAGSSSLRNPT